MAEKNGFNITKLIFQNMCVWQCGAVVKEFLAPADEPGSTPGEAAFSVSLYSFLLIIIIIIISGALACAKRARSGAPWVRKFGKLSIREKFGYDVESAHPYTHFM